MADLRGESHRGGRQPRANEGFRRPARDAGDDRGHELVYPRSFIVDLRAPEAIGDGGQHPAKLGLFGFQLRQGFALLAHIAGRNKGQRLRVDV